MENLPNASVTTSELAVLQILWDFGRPLNKQEILARALQNPEKPLFAKNSFHVLTNELIRKGYLVPVDNMGLGRKNARRYAPSVSRNEFWALQVAASEKYSARDIPELLAALIDFSSDPALGSVLDDVEDLIKRKRETGKKEKS